VTRQQALVLGGTVVLTTSLIGLVAYRLGLRQASTPAAGPFSAGSGADGSCVDFRDAQSRVGRTTCVSGRIVRVFTSRGGHTFLDFCANYLACPFGTVIFSSDREKFGNFGTLAGRQVEIRGTVTLYQGRAEIIIHDPQQIRLAP